MTNLDTLSKYKLQRTYMDYVISLNYEAGEGTWAIWSTSPYDPKKEIDPLRVVAKRYVKEEKLDSGTYDNVSDGIAAAKEAINSYRQKEVLV